MKKAGCSLQENAVMLDHSNYQSLESYLGEPEDEDYERYSDIMFSYGSKPNENLPAIEEAQVAKHDKSCLKSK